MSAWTKPERLANAAAAAHPHFAATQVLKGSREKDERFRATSGSDVYQAPRCCPGDDSLPADLSLPGMRLAQQSAYAPFDFDSERRLASGRRDSTGAQTMFRDEILEDFLTVNELAKQLKVGRRQIYKLIDAGTLSAIRLGPRLYRIPVTTARQLLVDLRVAAPRP